MSEGCPVPMLDAADKASGRARYLTDLNLPGLCHGAVVRSPHAHARVVAIDAAAALALPGVLAVVTAADAPPRPVPGEAFYDRLLSGRPVFFDEPTWCGAPVAAVVAESPDQARRAAQAVAVRYAVLPAALDLHAAMAPDAPQVRCGFSNFALPFGPLRLQEGDVDAAFATAAHVFDDTFTTATVQAAALEPYACLVEPHADGGLTVWKGTPAPFDLQQQLAAWLGVPLDRVRVRCPLVGGGFGSRMDDLEYVAAVLARRCQRPVRVELDRSEGFLAGRVRHGARLRVRSALTGDGTLIGRELEAWYDVGGHLDLGAYVILRALRPLALYRGGLAAGCAVRFAGHLLLSNRPVSGATRGFGNPQATFAVEAHTARICRDLGLDPVRFRLDHALKSGDRNLSVGVADTSTGQFRPVGGKIGSCRLEACLQVVQKALAEPMPLASTGMLLGRGLACAMHTSGKGRKEVSTARVELGLHGRAEVATGAPDQGGTGLATTLAVIAATALGLPVTAIDVRLGDTADGLEDSGAHASGRTFVTGEAVLRAAQAVAASRDAGAPLPIAATVRHQPSGNAPPFAACGAWVEVDAGTGHVRVVRLLVAVDIGHVLNPLQARGQVQGAAVQGLGFALSERLDFDPEGHLATRGLLDYGLPRAADCPDVEVVFVPGDEPDHPLGVKGVGEIGLMAVAPAVANAVADAIGVWVCSLPLTPERVWRALQDRSGREPTSPPKRLP